MKTSLFRPASQSRGWRTRTIAGADQGGAVARECISGMTRDEYTDVVTVLNNDDPASMYREDPDVLEVVLIMARSGLTNAVASAIIRGNECDND